MVNLSLFHERQSDLNALTYAEPDKVYCQDKENTTFPYNEKAEINSFSWNGCRHLSL